MRKAVIVLLMALIGLSPLMVEAKSKASSPKFGTTSTSAKKHHKRAKHKKHKRHHRKHHARKAKA
jgi:hypothetical protein